MKNINVFELKVNSGAGIPSFSTKDKFKCLQLSINVINDYKSVLDGIINFKNLEDINGEDFDLLMLTEEILAGDTSLLNEFDVKFLGSTTSTRRRLSCFCVADKSYRDMVNENTSAFTPYVSEELNTLEEIVKCIIGNLSSFVYYQFGLNELVNCKEEEIDSLNDALDYYMNENQLDVNDIIQLSKSLKDNIFKCIPNIGLFELHPELLESFDSLLGVDLYDCENVDEKLMLDYFNGKMTQEEFQLELEKLRQANGDL